MITKRQKEVLDFVTKHRKSKGYAPSLEEICKKFKLASVSTAHFHVSKLKDGGYITRKKNEITSLIEKLRKIAERALFGTSDGGAEK